MTGQEQDDKESKKLFARIPLAMLLPYFKTEALRFPNVLDPTDYAAEPTPVYWVS